MNHSLDPGLAMAELEAALRLSDNAVRRMSSVIARMVRPHTRQTGFIDPNTMCPARLWFPEKPIVIHVDAAPVTITGVGYGWYKSEQVRHEFHDLSLRALRALYKILVKQLPKEPPAHERSS
jgi:hypothetical protein